MGREVKRVPVDFDAPLDQVWTGYVTPEPTEPPVGDGWQVWENVSEGSPITPVFPTAEALVDHLATVGTTWDQMTGYDGRPPKGPWRREAAEAFVKSGWAPSFMAIDGRFFDGARDADAIEASR